MNAELRKIREKVRSQFKDDWRIPIYKGFFHIRDKEGNIIPFVPNKHQVRIIELIWDAWTKDEPFYLIVHKCRQFGASTVISIVNYAINAFTPGRTSTIMADKLDNSNNLFEMVKLCHDEMNPIVKTEIKANNAKRFEFADIKSLIKIETAENRRAGHSGTYQFIHCSEVAHYPDADKAMGSLLQTAGKKGRVIVVLESTSNGVGNYWYDVVMDAYAGKNRYKLLFVPWFEHEEYQMPLADGEEIVPEREGLYGDETEELRRMEAAGVDNHKERLKWRRFTIVNDCKKDLPFFRQEYPGTVEEAFIGSGFPVFDHYKLTAIAAMGTSIPRRWGLVDVKAGTILLRQESYGALKVWDYPVTGVDPVTNRLLPRYQYRYCIGADTGGVWDGADYSVCYVYDRLRKRVAACLHGHFDPYEYADMLILLGRWYGYGKKLKDSDQYEDQYNARIGVEINRWSSETEDQGETVIEHLRKKYRNQYTRKVRDDQTKEWTFKLGFHTNAQTKGLLVDTLRQIVDEWDEADAGHIALNDYELIEEMKTYIINQTETGKTAWEAQKGKKDDRVMAFGITMQISKEMPAPKLIDENRSSKVNEEEDPMRMIA